MKHTKETVKDVLRIIDEMFFNSEKISFYSVSKKANVSRSFLYKQDKLNKKICYYRQFNNSTLEERIKHLKDKNIRYRNNIRKIEKDIYDMTSDPDLVNYIKNNK